MQVKVIQEPIVPADLYQAFDVLVLPIFTTPDIYEAIAFDCVARRRVVLDYLNSQDVTFIGLPDNVAVLFLSVNPQHSKKRILRHAKRLYRASVTDDYSDFDIKLPGLRNALVVPASDEPASEYLRMPASRSPLIIWSGDDRLDKIYRSKIRSGEFAKYTPDTLAHPTVRAAFGKLLHTIGLDNGFDVEIINLIRHRRKLFVTCDVMEVEAS